MNLEWIEAFSHAPKAEVTRLRTAVRSHRLSQRKLQRRVDGDQDARIERLEDEVDELRVDLAAVVSLLVQKGVLAALECRVIAETPDDAAD